MCFPNELGNKATCDYFVWANFQFCNGVWRAKVNQLEVKFPQIETLLCWIICSFSRPVSSHQIQYIMQCSSTPPVIHDIKTRVRKIFCIDYIEAHTRSKFGPPRLERFIASLFCRATLVLIPTRANLVHKTFLFSTIFPLLLYKAYSNEVFLWFISFSQTN